MPAARARAPNTEEVSAGEIVAILAGLLLLGANSSDDIDQAGTRQRGSCRPARHRRGARHTSRRTFRPGILLLLKPGTVLGDVKSPQSDACLRKPLHEGIHLAL